MLHFILKTNYKIKVLWAGTLSDTMAGGAFSKVYKNNHIYKDSVKLLSASGQSQPDLAYNTGMNGEKCSLQCEKKI
ncbi:MULTISPECIES: hypothetical protein [unclassified Microcoleus]|uniref:hypothetical protein n=1 Tax=unclassified Microcoleus TaxID=2642155 RepID=UPI002FD5FA11